MAVTDGAKSIGFPTVGCSRLGYNPKDVVDSFVRSHGQNRSELKVTIAVKKILFAISA